MYPFDTLLNAGQVVEVPRQRGFLARHPSHPGALRERAPKVVFLTAPNNPDGRLPDGRRSTASPRQPCLVVIDEAYIEFTQGGGRLGEARSRIRQVAQRENLVVLRTFSKWAGLAGLRVGYGAFPAWLMPVLWKAKQPYNVNVAASSAALASLDDLEALAANVAKIQAERARLFDRLQSIPFLHPHPSEATSSSAG